MLVRLLRRFLAPHGGALVAVVVLQLVSTVAMLIARYRSTAAAVVAAYRGKRGHPLVLPPATRAALLTASPETTLKAALIDLRVAIEEMDVEDAGVVRDVDVRSDLE